MLAAVALAGRSYSSGGGLSEGFFFVSSLVISLPTRSLTYIAPEDTPKPEKESIVFQPSFFRGFSLLNFRGVRIRSRAKSEICKSGVCSLFLGCLSLLIRCFMLMFLTDSIDHGTLNHH